jgi:NAD(P)-dependent dehydrogenase (short-subunit alcohol dehydrogenase family)
MWIFEPPCKTFSRVATISGHQKTGIVTGASQGIGAGIGKGFVEQGFDVVANSRKVT